MSTMTPVPTVPQVRTFAADLTATRALRGLTAPSSRPSPKPVAPRSVKKATATSTLPVKERSILVTKTAVVTVPAPRAKVVAPVTHPQPTAIEEKPIPPFHTFKKAAQPTAIPLATIDTSEFEAANKKSQPSVLATPGVEPLTVARASDEANSGTIITDTKHKHFSLFGAIGTSLGEWWRTRQKNAAKRKKPKYMVPDADRRKGVIQKATTQTGRTSTSDHAAVVTRIKSAKKTSRGTAVTAPHISPPPPTGPAAGWSSSDTDGVVPSIQSTTPPHPTISAVQTVEDISAAWEGASQTEINTSAVPTPVQPRILPIIPPLPITVTRAAGEATAHTVPIQTSASISITPITPVIPSLPTRDQEITAVDVTAVRPPAPMVIPIERPRITPIIPVLSLVVEPELPPAISALVATDSFMPEAPLTRPNWSQVLNQESITQRPEIRFAKPNRNVGWWQILLRQTNRLTLGVGGLCVIGLIGYLGIQTWWVNSTSTTPVAEVPATVFSASVLTAPTTVAHSKDDLAAIMKAATQNDESLVEVTLTSPQTRVALTPAEFFTLLGATPNISFLQSITRVTVGNYRTEPWIVLSTADGATARGGMLAEENELSAHLAPWFGAVVHHSAKAGITLFHDGVIAGHDVRILTDGAGTERIIYGFISPEKILVTSNTTAFLNLAEKI